MTTMVAVGRSIDGGTAALSYEGWKALKEDVKVQLWLAGFRLVSQAEGVGEYTDDDGVTYEEECAIFVAKFAKGESFTEELQAEKKVGLLLADVAREYGQDSIAVVHGATLFAGKEAS